MTVTDRIFQNVAELSVPNFFITVEFSVMGNEMPEHIESFVLEKYQAILHGANGRNRNQLLFPAGQRKNRTLQQPFDVHLRTHRLDPRLHDLALQRDIFHPERDFIGCVGGKELAAWVLKDTSHYGS